MSTSEVLTVIQTSAVAHAISKSDHLVGAALQVVHVMGFILLLAALVLMSLRLLGVILKQQAVADVIADASRLLWIGLALAVVSGTLMFVSSPKLYFYKVAFELKMLLFVVAVLVQFTVFRKVAKADSPRPVFVRATVALSLVTWFGIGLAGRMIGFT